MFTSTSSRAASAYKRVAVETSVQSANPHSLVELLFDALLHSLATTRGAMARGDVIAKGQAIGKAVRIIEEGLKAGLNLREGGDLAQNLHIRMVEEVVGLIEPVASSWKLIRGPGPAYLQPVPGRGA